MPITLKHDAFGVVAPSNQSTRMYGQSLVLQQQQQKYAGQQAGYDRLFDAYRQQNQNAFQWGRDAQQNAFQLGRDNQQNAFQVGRDKAQFDQQQQAAEAERQRAFLEEGRKQQSGYITEGIKNGEYDPATARKLQQNLVSEAEALGNPSLDATQRAEVLQKLRAERATLAANRMEPPPKPTPQEQFNQGIVTDPETGMRYRPNAKGDYEPLPQQPQRPSSATEAFAADPKARDKYMEDAKTIVTEGGEKPLTKESRKEAADLARQLWEDDNLPTQATTLPGETPSVPGAEQSILETPQAPPVADVPVVPPDPAQAPDPFGAPPQPRVPWNDGAFDAPEPSSPQNQQNAWAELQDRTKPAGSQGESNQGRSELITGQSQQGGLPQVAPPDFGKLVESAEDEDDKAVISQVQGLVSQHADSPDIVNALNVLVSSGSPSDRVAAFKYLQSAGVDLKQMIAREPSKAEKIKGVQEKNKERFGSSRDLLNGM